MKWYGLLLLAACGSQPGLPDATGAGDDDAAGADAAAGDDASVADAAATTPDATPAAPDAFPGVLDVRIDCHNDCTLHANPASIAVPAGTEFEVNWINVGDTECDVAKIDEFNSVPIILGLEPGTSYHDAVRQWCGSFTGTFEFEIRICTIPSYIPVDCDG